MKFTRILKRACLIFFGMLSALAVNAQSNPDIMLYTTDFTGWTALAEPGSETWNLSSRNNKFFHRLRYESVKLVEYNI